MRLGFAAVLLLLVSAAQGAETDLSVGKPEVKPGDRWTYRRVNYRSNATVETYELRVTFAQGDVIHGVFRRLQGIDTDAARTGGVPMLAAKKDDEADATWTSEWNSVSSPDGVVHRTHSGIFRFPLQPGVTYSREYEFRRPREGGRGQQGEQTVRVSGWEEVEVPAGRFRALKVQASGRYRRLDTNSTGTETTTCWYVPQVKRSVKCTYESWPLHRGEELIKFELRQ